MTSQSLLRLMAWLSPSFPIGAYSYSHGLERAVEEGLVHNCASLIAWVEGVLRHGSGRLDAGLFLLAYHARGDALDLVVEKAEALRGTAELALESAAQGKAFLTAVTAAWPQAFWPEWTGRLKAAGRAPAYPVVVAVAAALAEIPEELALAAVLHAFAANLVSAAVRLVPLGQTDGQRAIAALETVVQQVNAAALTRSPEDLGSAAPMVDWCSMTHEIQYTRLFRS